MADRLAFTKGHGTENDFVLVPDLDGTLGLSAGRAVALADRRVGVGGDGVIRVAPTASSDEDAIRAQAGLAQWFMDYRNADGSVSQMCGNGTRVFAEFLRQEGLETGAEFHVATRAGAKRVRRDGAGWAVDLGPWRLADATVADRDGFDALVHLDDDDDIPDPYSALSVDVGNPHTVVALPETVLLDSIDLSRAPAVRPEPPHGTNVELVRPIGPGHLAMRVHERGVGETRSCGSGAVAAAVATSFWAGTIGDHPQWLVEVPGGQLTVRLLPGHGAELAGPAVIVAHGTVACALLPD
ncbi:MAG: diaminopimelate epimerase [Dermatophilaceae bacterium]